MCNERVVVHVIMLATSMQDLIQSDGGEGESSEPESSAVCSVPVS